MNKFIHRSKWPLLGFLVLMLATVPVWGTDYLVFFCLLFCVYLAMSQVWNLLIGYSGLFSLGQPAFIGLSGYTVAAATLYFGLSVWASLLVAGLLSFHLQGKGGLLRDYHADFSRVDAVVIQQLGVRQVRAGNVY
jgi:ABC-type branched-subunit amino acid transport system permease subunit